MRRTLLVIVLAVLVAACGGGSYSNRAAAYIPPKVDGTQVTPAADATSGRAFLGLPSGTQVAVATAQPPSAGRSRFGLVLVAASGSRQVLDAARQRVNTTYGTGSFQRETVGGTTVEYREFTQGPVRGGVAVARPRPDVVVAAFGFTGGTKQARDAVAAMLSAGRR